MMNLTQQFLGLFAMLTTVVSPAETARQPLRNIMYLTG
jgi:hypothetical protein